MKFSLTGEAEFLFDIMKAFKNRAVEIVFARLHRGQKQKRSGIVISEQNATQQAFLKTVN